MIALKNKMRRMRVFNLDAPFFVKRHGETLYGRPETLTLLALERREVEDAVLACTEIKAARDAGTLRVYPSVKPASEPKAEEKSATVEPTPEPPPAGEPEPKRIESVMEPKPGPTTEPKAAPVAEVPKPGPKVGSKTTGEAKPSPKKTTVRRHAKED